jgi:hypothetical protein
VARADYKGSWARNSPDWLVENLASVGANNPSANGMFATTDLFNESQAGYSLWVYWIYINNFGTFSIRVSQVFGNCGGISGPAFPCVIGQAQPPGTLFVNALATHDIAQTDPYITSASPSALIDYIHPPGPVAVIPPGYSLRLQNNQPSFGFVATFYYVWKSQTR